MSAQLAMSPNEVAAVSATKERLLSSSLTLSPSPPAGASCSGADTSMRCGSFSPAER